MNEYNLGTSVRVNGSFKDITRVAFDPDTVTCAVKDPDGTEETYTYGVDAEVIKTVTGVYYLWVLPTLPGRWAYRFKGVTGAQSVANENVFVVSYSLFAAP